MDDKRKVVKGEQKDYLEEFENNQIVNQQIRKIITKPAPVPPTTTAAKAPREGVERRVLPTRRATDK